MTKVLLLCDHYFDHDFDHDFELWRHLNVGGAEWTNVEQQTIISAVDGFTKVHRPRQRFDAFS